MHPPAFGSDNYQEFLKVALSNPDLRLFSSTEPPDLTAEQKERTLIIFCMLMSLFERAYLLLYSERMCVEQARRWHLWKDCIREWCMRADFHAALPELLRGEDPAFAQCVLGMMNCWETEGSRARASRGE